MNDARVRLVSGVVWLPLDDTMHAAYSPLSGETLLLNDTAIWVLERLAEPGWHRPDDVLRQAALEAERPEGEVRVSLGNIWATLQDAGLVRREPPSAPLNG